MSKNTRGGGSAAEEYHLTPSARAILAYLKDHEGEPVTKAVIASELGRCEKTIDRLMSGMRENGLIEVKENWTKEGAQLANSYSLSSTAKTI